MYKRQILSIILFFTGFLLFFSLPVVSPACAGQTIVHHQPHGTVIIYSKKSADDGSWGQPVSLQWDFPQDTAVTLNLLFTAPATILTHDAVTISQNHPSAGGVFHYQVITAVKAGRLELITKGAFLDARSYVEAHADNSPWSVVIKRADKSTEKDKEVLPAGSFADFPETFSGATPSTIKSEIYAGGYSGTDNQDDTRRKPRGRGVIHENNIIATLTALHQENNDKTPNIIFVVIATNAGQYYDLITHKEWNGLQNNGKANITGLMELIRSHLEADREYQDSVALIHQILQRQQQDIVFNDDDTLLSVLLNELKPPEYIEILAPDSPPFVYLGKKKKKTSTPAGDKEQARSENTPASSGSSVETPATVTAPSRSGNDELPPPLPPGAIAASIPADMAAELDIQKIIISSLNRDTITTPSFIMALHGVNLITWSEALDLLKQSELLGVSGFVFFVSLLHSVIAVAERDKEIETKLLFLRLLHTYLLARNDPDRIASLLEKIPEKYHASVQRRYEFSATLFQEQPSSLVLRQLVAFSTIIPDSANQLLRRYPVQINSPHTPEGDVAEFLGAINLPSDLVIAWGYIKELLTTGQLATIADIPGQLALGINDFNALFAPHATTFSFPGFEFLLEPDVIGASAPDISVSILDRFHPLSPEFKQASALAQDLVNGQNINSVLAEMTRDEILMILTVATRKLSKVGKINGSQAYMIQMFLKMVFQASRGILPDEIITLTELAMAFETGKARDASITALMEAFFRFHGPAFQYFNLPAAEQISGFLSSFGKNVLEIGAGNGMLSSALGEVGFSVFETTDAAPPFFPCFNKPVTSKSALAVLREYGDTMVYVVASPDREMMLDIVRSGLRAVFVLLGHDLGAELGQYPGVHQVPVVLSAFHSLLPSQNAVLFINVGEAERHSIEKRIPNRFKLIEKKKKPDKPES